VVVDTATRLVTTRLKLGRGASAILSPPDGAPAYVVLSGDNAIAIIELKTFTEIDRIETGSGPAGMSWLARK
jgi:YVTN family beta-propeller protein